MTTAKDFARYAPGRQVDLFSAADVLMARKRIYSKRILALRAVIERDQALIEGLRPATRARLLQELAKCASSFVLKTSPWRYTPT